MLLEFTELKNWIKSTRLEIRHSDRMEGGMEHTKGSLGRVRKELGCEAELRNC